MIFIHLYNFQLMERDSACCSRVSGAVTRASAHLMDRTRCNSVIPCYSVKPEQVGRYDDMKVVKFSENFMLDMLVVVGGCGDIMVMSAMVDMDTVMSD